MEIVILENMKRGNLVVEKAQTKNFDMILTSGGKKGKAEEGLEGGREEGRKEEKKEGGKEGRKK